MRDIYRVARGIYWGVELDGNFARRLRNIELDESFRQELMARVAVDIGERAALSFVNNSILLQSATCWYNSSCSLYMDSCQRDFFLGSSWRDGELPVAIGGDGEEWVFYGGHNNDTSYIEGKLAKAWMSWFEGVRNLV